MAVANGLFRGEVDGKTITDYLGKVKYEVDDFEQRKKIVEGILNLDHIGSKDGFWVEVWDMGICKTALNKEDALWTDTNVAQALESMGTYLITKSENKNRYSRPKEVSMFEDYSGDCIKNDKNYRLAPPDDITSSDYSPRKIFSKDYNYYKDVLYPKYIDRIKLKVSEDMKNIYGYHDGSFDDFSCGRLMTEEKWNNLRRLELQKVKFLLDAKPNLEELKRQNKMIREGGGALYLKRDGDDVIKAIEIYKYDFINRTIPCNRQLEKMGINNMEIKAIEYKHLYKKRTKNCGVGVKHVVNTLGDTKGYMIDCKLAYNNRVCIDAGKISANRNILDHVDYTNLKHIEAILYMQGEDISYENDMSIIAYDITKAIKELRDCGKLDDKDLYIIEGIRHRITQEQIASELGINERTVRRRIGGIVDKIKNFW
ncbi:MAG: hypothetical protein ACRDDY_16485 [Clostridium sp.]|uniref:hypothetical protein n=1 Tax=Clostridium sp. TaxID=1506 RepID=UPI003EE688D8